MTLDCEGEREGSSKTQQRHGLRMDVQGRPLTLNVANRGKPAGRRR